MQWGTIKKKRDEKIDSSRANLATGAVIWTAALREPTYSVTAAWNEQSLNVM